MLQPFCWEFSSSAPYTTGEVDIRALMVVCRYFGDVLLATPLAQSLTQAGYSVDWLVAPGGEALLAGQPCADRVRVVNQHTPWHRQLSMLTRMFRKYDRAFALPSTDRSMLFALSASRSTYALIVAGRSQEAWKRRLVDHWVDYSPGAHMVSLACELAEAAGLPPCREVQICWQDADAKQLFSELPWSEQTPYIHLHPFARWPYKWWPFSAWRELMGFAEEQGLRIVITGSPDETEQAGRLAGTSGSNVCVLAGKLNWRQLACLSHYARAYVGLDTANTHLAATTGTPVIALFGPTDPRIWGPWPNGFPGASPWQASSSSGIQRQGNISLLQGRQECVPCQLEGCDRHQGSTSRCLQEMKPEWVWQEILVRLHENNQQRVARPVIFL